MPTPAVKRCYKCQRDLSLDSFHKNRATRDGYATWCKECVAINHAAYRQRHTDKMAAYLKEYRETNAERLKAKRIEYCKAHAAEKAAYAKANAKAINARRRAKKAEQRNLQSDEERESARQEHERLKAERKAAREAKLKAKREAAREAARAKQSKVCPCCDVEKPLEEFGVSARYKDGRNCWCKACVVAKVRAYQKAHPEKIKSYKKQHEARKPVKSKVQHRGTLRTCFEPAGNGKSRSYGLESNPKRGEIHDCTTTMFHHRPEGYHP